MCMYVCVCLTGETERKRDVLYMNKTQKQDAYKKTLPGVTLAKRLAFKIT